MTIDRSLITDRRERFDVVRYRQSLQTLGLTPPVVREDIDRAYRGRASRTHPDRFATLEEREEATRRIQEINAAREYANRHFRGFDLWQSRTYRPERNGRSPRGPRWARWAPLLPVTALYALATLVAALPAAVGVVSRIGPTRGAGEAAWRLWLLVVPHGLAAGFFLLADQPLVEAWLGVSLLVMLSSDVATFVTGDENALREHPPMDRARALADVLVRPV